jgi:hypothetical protein
MEDFVRKLSEMNIRVRVACYTDQKFVPHFFIPKLLQDIITFKDLNWYFQPQKVFVKDFVEENFDILLDLTLTDNLPLLYLAVRSKAGLKIGRFQEDHQEYYDLMIDLPSESSIEYFIEQIMYYLQKINIEN